MLIPFLSKAQQLNNYKASNGVTYRINDTIKLGKGSKPDGSFLYVEDRGPGGIGLPGPGRGGSHSLPKEFTNGGVILKSIRKVPVNGVDKYLFMVNPGGLFRYSMFIDDAIAACEVKPCAVADDKPASVSSVADELLKLKKLLDAGAITQAEYDKQKKKLLGE